MSSILQSLSRPFLRRKSLAKELASVPYESGASIKLSGVVFVFLSSTGAELSSDLASCAMVSLKHQARVFGMLNGLLQLLIHGKSVEDIQDTCKGLASDVMAACHGRAITVWTVRECEIGCWGNENWMNYGAMAPNFQEIMRIFGSAKPGTNLEV